MVSVDPLACGCSSLVSLRGYLSPGSERLSSVLDSARLDHRVGIRSAIWRRPRELDDLRAERSGRLGAALDLERDGL